MYERFTDRARKVMQLANQEAQRFNHEYIGTEHILLGLVREGSGVAANVLKNLDIDLRKIRLEVEKIVQSGPDMVTLGKLPQTPKAKKVIEYAIEEARNLNFNYVGTENLLLGLLREGEGVAAQVLMNLGLKLSDVRKEVLQILGYEIASEESCNGPSPEEAPPSAEQERIQSLEKQLANMRCLLEALPEDQCGSRDLSQQLWNVRVVLGALTGSLAGVLLAAPLGGVLGLILGGVVAAIGWRIPAALAGGISGALLGSAHLPREGGGLSGALLGALAAILIAEIGSPSDRRGFANLWRRK
jgi:hypothetical protein